MNDLIKRQDAIDEANAWLLECFKVQKQDRSCGLIRRLEDLPSAFGIGHWVEIGDEPYDEWECDVCGFTIDGSGCIDPYAYRDIYRFCPHCGCRMVSEEEKDYERAIEDVQYNALYEPTYNQEDGSL